MPELPIKLELSRLSRFDVLNLLAPLVPGGVVLGAVVLRNWPLASSFIHSSFPGYYSKMTILVLAAYFVGFLVTFMSEALSRVGAAALDKFLPRKNQNPAFQPWNALEWRRLARLFIGPKLTPETDMPLDQSRYQRLAAAIEQISDPNQKRVQAEQLVQARDALLGADVQWQNWYLILRNYINSQEAFKDELFRHRLVFFGNACGFAGLIALVLVPDARNWFLWLLFGATEVICLLFQFVLLRNQSAWPAYDNIMSAQLLRIVREERVSKAEIEPAAKTGEQPAP